MVSAGIGLIQPVPAGPLAGPRHLGDPPVGRGQTLPATTGDDHRQLVKAVEPVSHDPDHVLSWTALQM